MASLQQAQALIDGKYQLVRRLGEGGMGSVYEARHLGTGRRVAVKMVSPEVLAKGPDIAERFRREAMASGAIESQYIAHVLDTGVDAVSASPYIVMELLVGEDLQHTLVRVRRFTPDIALRITAHACMGLQKAHDAGVIHRDVKPANLYLTRRDHEVVVKLLDFGIAKVRADPLAEAQADRTHSGMMLGSPLYMSPEQMRSSKDVDAQTDIWALGVILFELISGRPPFQGDSITELAIKINNEAAPPIQSVRPDVPGELQTTVSKCLEKDRRRRYRNVAELALALVPFAPKRAQGTVDRISGIIHASGLSTSTLTAPPLGQPSNTRLSTGTLPAMGRTTAGSYARKPARWKAVAGGLLAGVVLLVAIVFSVLAWKRRSAPGEMAQTPTTVSSSMPPQQPARGAAAADVNPTETSLAVPMPPAAQSATLAAPTVANAPLTLKRKSVPPVSSTPVAAAATSPPAPAVKCDPPYYFDPKGNRIFKKECL